MSDKSVLTKLLKSSFWQYLGSWTNRLVGFVSTVILARILTPDDFGVIAAIAIVTGLFNVISAVGTEYYLIRKPDIDDDDLNTGWTINIVMRLLSVMAIISLADVAAEFMGDDRLVLGLKVISLSPMLSGFNNIGMVLYERGYNYKPLFMVTLVSRLVAFTVKIGLAFYLKDYWAFVIADVVERLLFTVMTFMVQPYRPKISLKNCSQQWGFSQWILFKSIFIYAQSRIDNIVLSKYFPLEALGVYTVSKELATLPAGQIVEPIMNPLYVSLSSVHKEPKVFADRVYKVLFGLFLIVVPISLGIYSTADNLVYLVLGEQWLHAIPLTMVLSMMLIPSAMNNFFNKALTALGNVKLIFMLELIYGVFFVVVFLVLAEGMQIIDFAKLRVVVVCLNSLLVAATVAKLAHLSFFRVLMLMCLPVFSAVVMVQSIFLLNPFLEGFDRIRQFAIQVVVGAMVYGYFVSSFIYLLRNVSNESQFIWKSFYVAAYRKIRGY